MLRAIEIEPRLYVINTAHLTHMSYTLEHGPTVDVHIYYVSGTVQVISVHYVEDFVRLYATVLNVVGVQNETPYDVKEHLGNA